LVGHLLGEEHHRGALLEPRDVEPVVNLVPDSVDGATPYPDPDLVGRR
jgi:hypothetical protein